MFPYLHRDSTLYFASTGHPGLGGSDIFYSRLGVSGPGLAFNLGYPMNTRHNDHGLIFFNDTTGFFTSDRPGYAAEGERRAHALCMPVAPVVGEP